MDITTSLRYISQSYNCVNLGNTEWCQAQSNGILIKKTALYRITMRGLVYDTKDKIVRFGVAHYNTSDKTYTEGTFALNGGDGIHLQIQSIGEYSEGILIRPVIYADSTGGVLNSVWCAIEKICEV